MKRVETFSSDGIGGLQNSINDFMVRRGFEILSVQYQAFVTSRNVERYTAVVLYECP